MAACCDQPSFISNYFEPFLIKLGSDELCASSCRQPLTQLLSKVYSVPGLLDQIVHILNSDAALLPNPRGISWFALSVAQRVERARSDPALIALIAPLDVRGGAGAAAARQLRVLTGAGGTGEKGAGEEGEGSGEAVAVEDLMVAAGGRHDNDKVDFRWVRVHVWAPPTLVYSASKLVLEHGRATGSH